MLSKRRRHSCVSRAASGRCPLVVCFCAGCLGRAHRLRREDQGAAHKVNTPARPHNRPRAHARPQNLHPRSVLPSCDEVCNARVQPDETVQESRHTLQNSGYAAGPHYVPSPLRKSPLSIRNGDDRDRPNLGHCAVPLDWGLHLRVVTTLWHLTEKVSCERLSAPPSSRQGILPATPHSAPAAQPPVPPRLRSLPRAFLKPGPGSGRGAP